MKRRKILEKGNGPIFRPIAQSNAIIPNTKR